MNSNSIEDAAVDLQERRVPALVTYLSPFRIIESDESDNWSASIQEVNGRSWDYVGLHEIAGGVDVGLQAPYHLVLGRDGALALPPIPELRSHQAGLEFFNKCLAGLLLGGVYCEAISTDGLDLGSIIDWTYIRSHQSGLAAVNTFHKHIRYGKASPLDAIVLNEPASIGFDEVNRAMTKGLGLLNDIEPLRPEFLLKGVTSIARRDFAHALANLWIAVEQLISNLWETHVLTPAKQGAKIRGRMDSLKDTRTWTISTRIELLYQIGILDSEAVDLLGIARRARNALSHEGVTPSESTAKSAYLATTHLLQRALPDREIPLLDIDLSDHSISDPFKPHKPSKIEPKYWMEIPKLPGEIELERAEAGFRKEKED